MPETPVKDIIPAWFNANNVNVVSRIARKQVSKIMEPDLIIPERFITYLPYVIIILQKHLKQVK